MSLPVQIVVFGASGDLTRRKLVPALVRLAADERLKNPFSVLGVSRSPKSETTFRAELAEAVPKELRARFDELAPRIFYQQGDVTSQMAVAALGRRLDGLPGGSDTGRLFYLSLSPELFQVGVEALARAGLLGAAERERAAWRRLIVEKPFGRDLASARALNAALHQHLREDQIYRIDHYLGKETVQNLLGFRFHNAIFEPIWNRNHVELVQITAAESIGVERGRAAYYDETGGLRDMVQNHMLQILALVSMEPPATLDPDAVRGQKVELLRGLSCAEPRGGVRARYARAGKSDDSLRGYVEEEGVPRDSETETYVALRAEIHNWRWSGVPFLLRHGKRLPERFTEIQVRFRTPPLQLFNRPEGMPEMDFSRALRDGSLCQIRPNVLTLRLQPREAIRLSFGVKQPGNAMVMEPAHLDFDYREHFGTDPPEAYDRLLLDALQGDQTLFLRADEIEASWRFVDGVREAWDGPASSPLLEYPAGSWGPPEADALFEGCMGTWSRG